MSGASFCGVSEVKQKGPVSKRERERDLVHWGTSCLAGFTFQVMVSNQSNSGE